MHRWGQRVQDMNRPRRLDASVPGNTGSHQLRINNNGVRDIDAAAVVGRARFFRRPTAARIDLENLARCALDRNTHDTAPHGAAQQPAQDRRGHPENHQHAAHSPV